MNNIQELNKKVLPVFMWFNFILAIISTILLIFKINFNISIIIMILSGISLGTDYILRKYYYIWDSVKVLNKYTEKIDSLLK
jgi:hypothetical protein